MTCNKFYSDGLWSWYDLSFEANLSEGDTKIPSHADFWGTTVSGNTKGGSITVPLTSCLTGLDQSVFANKNKNCQLSFSRFQTSQIGDQR
jgi:hypothetical protein